MTPLEIELESQMLAMIDGILAAPVRFHDFAERSYRFVVDIPAFPDRFEFFGDAQEKLDDVSWAREEEADITPHDRELGAITRAEYLAWLRERRDVYRREFGR